MSMHFEWTLSLRLRSETPQAFLDELRYHLGMSSLAPREPALRWPYPVFGSGDDPDSVPGGPVRRLVRQELGAVSWAWGLLARVVLPDDEMFEVMQVVPPWLAPWSLTDGWIGFAREELDLDVWLNFFAAHGHAYIAPPGETPIPPLRDAPPFTLTQTTEQWPPNRRSGWAGRNQPE
ncbi:MAG: hypothetical protein ACRDP7_35585 [Trebonia sp.]